MNVKKVLSQLDVVPDEKTMGEMKRASKQFVALLKKHLKANKIKAEVFIGGSFAKGTVLKSETYDIDVFVRFDWRYEDLSQILGPVIQRVAKAMNAPVQTMHGSRDYFQIIVGDGKITFEIIPVVKIKNVKEARNVTDMSYFHVNYIKKHLRESAKREILFAKKFCKAQEVYGAESYIQGFSGYALECLILNYGKFEKMLKAIAEAEERIIIDPAKHYKKKNEIILALNESKIQGPIVLVDPTWKERNVLAALSRESFEKFQVAARAFLKSPSVRFFEKKKFDVEVFKQRAKKKGAEFLHMRLTTDRQEGDIAGTKMKKFMRFFLLHLGEYYKVFEHVFIYSLEKSADVYLSAVSKKQILRIGPPVKMKEHVAKFKKEHPNAFEKNGEMRVYIKAEDSIHNFALKFVEEYSETIKEMGITDFEIVG